MENIYFHIAAFDINKIASLRPAVLDWGPFSNLVTQDFSDLWKQIFRNVWAQWRWENDDPHYAGPDFEPTAEQSATEQPPIGQPSPAPSVPPATQVTPGETTLLQFCGGGKDSLVSMKLLERAQIPFDSFTYSSSIYGLAGAQHDLIDTLLDKCAPLKVRHQWIFEDFLDSPVLHLHGDISAQSLTAAETPSSVFAALPYALQHGYTNLSLGHERSADTGQVFWEKTQEDVNHQWGKSLEAEVLLNTYIKQHLVSNVSYFSILKAIYDVLIFNLLRKDADLLPYAHSCNVAKPWCKKCPKCAYVWLSYMAWLPTEQVDAIFDDTNLFDLPENQETFKQLLGLDGRLPFECIGQVGECQLAFELCRRKGLSGQALDRYVASGLKVDVDQLLDHYTQPDHTQSEIPQEIWQAIEPQLTAAQASAISYAKGI